MWDSWHLVNALQRLIDDMHASMRAEHKQLTASSSQSKAAELYLTKNETKLASGTWMWSMDESQTDDGRVRDAVVCLNRDGWTLFRSYLGTGQIEVFDSELWALGVALWKSVARAEALQAHGVTTVAVFSDLQAAIRWTIYLDPRAGQDLARAINKHNRALHA